MSFIGAEMDDSCSHDLVYLKNISVKFGNIVALDGVDFKVGRNEIIGLLGDNGAGKSTLIKALVGFYKPVSGRMFFEGEETCFNSPREANAAGIEVAYQELALARKLSILQNFFMGRELRRRCGPFILLDCREMKAIVKAFLEEIEFPERSHEELIHFLPGGLRQLIEIYRADYFVRKLLILDEPTAALSESETNRVLRLVEKAKERGISVVFVTHSAYEVFQVADRFVVLQNGKNYADLKREDTSLKELEKLIISSRLSVMKEIVGSVAHQLRNPLGIMKFSAEMLHDDFKVSDDHDSYHRVINMIINEVEVLENVVNNFLSFARPPQCALRLQPIENIIKDILNSLHFQDFNKVQIIVDIKRNLPKLMLDESLIKQALANVIINAIEASPPNSKIEIKAYMEKSAVMLEVRDWGCGMEEETLKKIFRPFFTTKSIGTGLGLPIVKSIIEQHGGKMEVRSVPGQGTDFILSFAGR